LWTHDARGEDETDVICDQVSPPLGKSAITSLFEGCARYEPGLYPISNPSCPLAACVKPDKPYEATNTSDCGAQVRVSVVKVDTFMLDRFSTHEVRALPSVVQGHEKSRVLRRRRACGTGCELSVTKRGG
jgi:hypothetical protein